MTGEESDQLSRTEQRLLQLLEPLRTNAPSPAQSLVERTMRSARWQRSVRAPLFAAGQLASAIVDALRILLGPGGPR